MIRALIAEDEPLARRHLRTFIADEYDLVLVGEAEDGDTAARLIDSLKPDLVFMDVRMPESSGLAVLERAHHKPAIIFTTAYDEYAVAAFELAAVDYLLKPFGHGRFREGVSRARRLLAVDASAPDATMRVSETLRQRPLRRLFVRERHTTRPVSVHAIDRFEACDDYVAVHTGGRKYLISITLQCLEQRLDDSQFLRIHRSHVINLDGIAAIHSHDGARMVVRMTDGAEIIASRSGTRRLRELLL